MSFLLPLVHSLRHPLQFTARLPDLVLHLVQLLAVHLRHGFREPPTGAFDNGHRHLQITLQRRSLCSGRQGRCGRRGRLPLRFQK
jgi:hypothetical protein